MRAELDPYFLERIKGFLDPQEGERLYGLALAVSSRGPCLEIGSYCGKSSVYLGSACRRNGGILFSIDHHRGSEEQQPGEAYFDPDLFDPASGRVDTLRAFRDTIDRADLADTVVALVCRSETAARMWRTPLSLVFIDGGHSYEAALTDYRLWHPHLMAGGYLLMHDLFEDPAEGGQAPYEVYRLALASGKFRELPKVKTLGALERIEE